MCNDHQLRILTDFLDSIDLPDLPSSWTDIIIDLFRAVTEANKTINLTKIVDLDDYLIKHIADSLLIRRVVPEIGNGPLQLADVGCGAGFPGIPIALTFAHTHCVEIDSARRKVIFVQGLIRQLELVNCVTVCGRARELSLHPDYRECFDIVVARAVKETSTLIRECRKFLRPNGGRLICYKTPAMMEKERDLVNREAAKYHLIVSASDVYDLPDDRGKRQFWIIEDKTTNE